MNYITVKELAELRGVSERYVRKQISEGKYQTEQRKNKVNGRMQYYILVSSLPIEIQKQINPKMDVKQHKKPVKKVVKKQIIERNFNELSQKERDLVAIWTQILMEWEQLRAAAVHGKYEELDNNFVGAMKLKYPDMDFSRDILYRKYKAYTSNSIEGLLDHRGAWNKGRTTISDEAWRGYLLYFHDENRRTYQQSYELMLGWMQEFYPHQVADIPSARSFRRRLDTIPKPVHVWMRYGEKALSDECLPYIEREYSSMNVNDCWVADNHTIDVMTKYDDKDAVHRLSITAFIDAKSGVMVGWNITNNPCSQSTIIALRHAIMRCGVPKVVYFDNGTEFLTYDIAGRGHRQRKSTSIIDRPPAILTRLGIEMRNALVKNAKAKPIERSFRIFKETISRLFDSYTGGNVLEKPEKLKEVLKNGYVPTDSKFREVISELIDGYYNQMQYGGKENKYKGFTRMDVFNQDIQNIQQRVVSASDLDLMLMRTTGYQKIGRKGVYINFGGEKLWYMDDDTWKDFDKQVYVRYDPEDMTTVRVYDKQDRFMYTLPCDEELKQRFIGASQEDIKTAQGKVNRSRKAVKAFAKGLTADIPAEQRIDALDIRVRQAHVAKQGFIIGKSKTVIPIRAENEQVTNVAVGSEQGVVIDMKTMNANARKRKEDD